MDTSLHSHLTWWHSQTVSSFRFAFCSYSLTSQRILHHSTSVSPPHYYHYNSFSAAVSHILYGHFSLFLSVLSMYAVSPSSFSHPSLPLMLRMQCHFVWQVFESPVEENRSRVLISHRLAVFPFFPPLLFKRLSKAMLGLSTHFSSCHSFRCSFFKNLCHPSVCVYLSGSY